MGAASEGTSIIATCLRGCVLLQLGCMFGQGLYRITPKVIISDSGKNPWVGCVKFLTRV